MVSLKYDNDRLQQLIQRKGINPSAVLNQQDRSSSEHRLSLGDPAGLGTALVIPQFLKLLCYELVLFVSICGQDYSDLLVNFCEILRRNRPWDTEQSVDFGDDVDPSIDVL